MKCGIRRDFEGVKSVTERTNEGKIVVEFSDGNIIAISRFIERNRKILIDFEKHKKNTFRYVLPSMLLFFSVFHLFGGPVPTYQAPSIFDPVSYVM